MKYCLVLLLSTFLLNSYAQQDSSRREKIAALKIGFLTKELNLSSEEAQKFWPIYNRYEDELEKLRKARRSEIMSVRENFESMSDAEINKAIDGELNFQQQEVDLKKRYVNEYRRILPPKKIAALLRAEQQFKIKLLQEYQRREGGPPGHPNPPPRPKRN